MTYEELLERNAQKSAFTLPEALIATVIVGIVAALTIPAMIAKKDKREWIVALDKAYSIVGEGFKQSQLLNQNANFWTEANFYDNFIEGFRVQNNCEDNSCLPEEKYLNGEESPVPEGARSYVLADGQIMTVNFTDVGCKSSIGKVEGLCGSVYMDVNGMKGPNTWGKDYFAFYVTTNGIIPYGSSKIDVVNEGYVWISQGCNDGETECTLKLDCRRSGDDQTTCESCDGTWAAAYYTPIYAEVPAVYATYYNTHAPIYTTYYNTHAPIYTTYYNTHAPIYTTYYNTHAAVYTNYYNTHNHAGVCTATGGCQSWSGYYCNYYCTAYKAPYTSYSFRETRETRAQYYSINTYRQTTPQYYSINTYRQTTPQYYSINTYRETTPQYYSINTYSMVSPLTYRNTGNFNYHAAVCSGASTTYKCLGYKFVNQWDCWYDSALNVPYDDECNGEGVTKTSCEMKTVDALEDCSLDGKGTSCAAWAIVNGNMIYLDGKEVTW